MAYRDEKVNTENKASKPIYNNQSKMANYSIVYDKKVQQNRNGFFNNNYKDLLWNETDTFWTVEAGFEHRTDLISNKFYGSAQFDWIIEAANNISDPIKDVVAGRLLIIPSQNRIFF